jgi:hypothetical protein
MIDNWSMTAAPCSAVQRRAARPSHVGDGALGDLLEVVGIGEEQLLAVALDREIAEISDRIDIPAAQIQCQLDRFEPSLSGVPLLGPGSRHPSSQALLPP